VDSAGNIHIVWNDYFDDIYYTKLDNNGNTLVDDTIVSAYSFYLPMGRPSLGVDSAGNIHINWSGYYEFIGFGNESEIYYTKLDNNGNILVNDTPLFSFPSLLFNDSSLGVDSSGNIHIARADMWEIYYTKLDNNGNTLANARLTFNASNSSPSLEVDSVGNIHIAWAGVEGIYYTKLDNNGDTLVDVTRLTFTGSRRPSLGVDSAGNIHITWSDNRDCNYEIYFTKGKAPAK
jgi:hypothetical protein